MNTVTLISVIMLIIPSLSFLSHYTRIRGLEPAVASLNVILALYMYLLIPERNVFYVDHTTWVFLVMVTSVYLLSLVYSRRYFMGVKMGMNPQLFYLLLSLFTTSMLFSLEIDNIGFMWVGIEATTISSALLLLAEKSETSLEATWRYIIIVSAGVTFAFFAVILIYYSLGTLSITAIMAMRHKPSMILDLAVAVALIGFGTKVGIFPVHTWLPDAHSEAPSPVSAMFSGVLLPTALYVLYRIYEIDPVKGLFVWAGTISVIVAALALGYQTRFKRMFAYSTMENMSLALIGLAVGGEYGLVGALLLLISHSFGKAGAFYSSGNMLRAYGSKKIDDIKGLRNSMPATSGSLLLSSFAVTGTPPFGTFFGEFLILYELLVMHYYAPFILVLFFLMAAFVAVNYNVSKMIFGGEPGEVKKDPVMAAVSMISAVLPLAIGVFYVVISYAVV